MDLGNRRRKRAWARSTRFHRRPTVLSRHPPIGTASLLASCGSSPSRRPSCRCRPSSRRWRLTQRCAGASSSAGRTRAAAAIGRSSRSARGSSSRSASSAAACVGRGLNLCRLFDTCALCDCLACEHRPFRRPGVGTNGRQATYGRRQGAAAAPSSSSSSTTTTTPAQAPPPRPGSAIRPLTQEKDRLNQKYGQLKAPTATEVREVAQAGCKMQ